MGAAKRRVGGAAATADQSNRLVVHAEVDRNLLVATTGQERRNCVDVRDLSAHGESRRHPDDVPFVDPLHQVAIGKLLGEGLEIAIGDVRANEDHALVPLGELVNTAKNRAPHSAWASRSARSLAIVSSGTLFE